MKKIRNETLLTLLVLWPIVGYPFLAATSSALGLNNSSISLSIRVLVVCTAVLLLVRSRAIRASAALYAFVLFWIIYFVRIYFVVFIAGERTSHEPFDYFMWAVGACFLPSLAILVCGTGLQAKKLIQISVAFLLITLVLLLFLGDTLVTSDDGQIVDSARLALTALNPISAGHLGVTALLLGVSLVVTPSTLQHSKYWAAPLILLGGYVMIVANSRGPILALVVCVALLVMARVNRAGTLRILLLFALILLGLYLSDFDASLQVSSIIERFDAASSGVDQSVGLRQISFSGAWTQFINSPLYGDGIEERVTGFYPHNVVLEAFMASGVLGGVPFLVLLALGLKAGFRIIRYGSRELWVGLIAIQYLVGAQFSGSLWQTDVMWVTLVTAIVVERSFSLARRIDSPVRVGRSIDGCVT